MYLAASTGEIVIVATNSVTDNNQNAGVVVGGDVLFRLANSVVVHNRQAGLVMKPGANGASSFGNNVIYDNGFSGDHNVIGIFTRLDTR